MLAAVRRNSKKQKPVWSTNLVAEDRDIYPEI
jgi:hypothetical protein